MRPEPALRAACDLGRRAVAVVPGGRAWRACCSSPPSTRCCCAMPGRALFAGIWTARAATRSGFVFFWADRRSVASGLSVCPDSHLATRRASDRPPDGAVNGGPRSTCRAGADEALLRGRGEDLPARDQRPLLAPGAGRRGRTARALLRPALAHWNGRQAVLFDLPARKFHIFGLTLLAAGLPLPRAAADHRGAVAVLLHRARRPAVVRLRLPADGVDRDLHLDRAVDRRHALAGA